jgi:protein phosphatase
MFPTGWWRRRCAGNDTPRICGGGGTHVGHVRERNEDVILIEPELGLYAVLDGMGGHSAGDVAARLAADEIAAFVRQHARIRRRWPRELLDFALRTASVRIFRAGERRWEHRGMGTTVVACLVADPTRVVVGHVGDSRAYLLRDRNLAALTRDHTVAQELVDAGEYTPERAARSIGKNMLRRHLGDLRVQPDVVEQTLRPGDRLLLCSDGLHGAVPERSIRRVLAQRGPPEQIAHRLVALALKGEASDNISAVVVAVDLR